jgi:endonuclease/exonuclease/phosphatase family metal-dependent hydrolase
MQRRLIVLTVFCTALLLSFSAVAVKTTRVKKTTADLKIMTYNIHHGAGMDKQLDLERIARVILQEKAEIAGLNEVYGAGPKFGNQVEEIHKHLEKLSRHPWYAAFGKNLVIPSGDYGNAVVSQYPIREFSNLHLPVIPENNEPRGLLSVKLDWNKKTLWWNQTHLAYQGWATTERICSVQTILNVINQQQGDYKILAGDFNASPGEESIQMVKSVMLDAWSSASSTTMGYTFPTDAPKIRIDYLFLPNSKSISVKECYVPDKKDALIGSDHRPLAATLIIKEK